MLKISAKGGPRINPRTGWTRAGFVCVGVLSPKLYTKCGRSLDADGAFSLVLLDPPGCNAHARGYGGLMKPMSQIKMS